MDYPIPPINDPELCFFDWEDKPLAVKDLVLFRVVKNAQLVKAPASWSVASVFHNSSEITRVKAIRMAEE